MSETLLSIIQVRESKRVTPRHFFYLRLVEFATKANLSRELGDELMELLHSFKASKELDEKFPRSWKTIWRETRKYRQTESFVSADEVPEAVKYPAEWNMEAWDYGDPPLNPVIQTRDVLQLIGRQLMNPEIIYGWGKHIQLKAFKQRSGNERSYGSVMSSEWAQHEEEELHKRSPMGTLLPIFLTSDGVALGSTNRQISTVLATCGIYDDTLMEQDIAVMCLNYLPKIPSPTEELIRHLMEKAKFTRTSAAMAIDYFKKHLERLFWTLVLRAIKGANEEGKLL
jgi:Plavaka transposase